MSRNDVIEECARVLDDLKDEAVRDSSWSFRDAKPEISAMATHHAYAYLIAGRRLRNLKTAETPTEVVVNTVIR